MTSMSMIDPASYDARMSHSLFGVLYTIGLSSPLCENGDMFTKHITFIWRWRQFGTAQRRRQKASGKTITTWNRSKGGVVCATFSTMNRPRPREGESSTENSSNVHNFHAKQASRRLVSMDISMGIGWMFWLMIPGQGALDCWVWALYVSNANLQRLHGLQPSTAVATYLSC